MNELIVVNKSDLIEIIKSVISPFFTPPSESISHNKRPVLLTRKEVAKLLHISLPTVDKHTESGLLKATYVGRRVLYNEDELLSNLDTIGKVIAKRQNSCPENKAQLG